MGCAVSLSQDTVGVDVPETSALAVDLTLDLAFASTVKHELPQRLSGRGKEYAEPKWELGAAGQNPEQLKHGEAKDSELVWETQLLNSFALRTLT